MKQSGKKQSLFLLSWPVSNFSWKVIKLNSPSPLWSFSKMWNDTICYGKKKLVNVHICGHRYIVHSIWCAEIIWNCSIEGVSCLLHLLSLEWRILFSVSSSPFPSPHLYHFWLYLLVVDSFFAWFQNAREWPLSIGKLLYLPKYPKCFHCTHLIAFVSIYLCGCQVREQYCMIHMTNLILKDWTTALSLQEKVNQRY